MFSYASVLVMAMFTLAVTLAFNHYRIYPGRIESDSLSSPGRGSDYIVVSWDDAHSTDVYKVWYKEIGPAEEVEIKHIEQIKQFLKENELYERLESED